MEALPYRGSTSDFYRVAQGMVLKSPMNISEGASNRQTLEEENKRAIDIERQILEYLGEHPRIVPYLQPYGDGILLSEARHGSLQTYIDTHHPKLTLSQRSKLCEQAAEAITYIHWKGVIHSDLRPENFLIAQANQVDEPDLWLCDFGGSMCEKLRLDGGHMPDPPFLDPRMKWVSTPATDIFSLGSIFYAIQTGFWPHMNGPPQWESSEAKLSYEERVSTLFLAGQFPDVSGICGGDVIKGCWWHHYKTVGEVLEAVRSRMVARIM